MAAYSIRALPRIGTDLHGGVPLLQWVVDSYTLVFAALLHCYCGRR